MMASSIKKLSECPVCFGEMIPPMKIFQCINGHSLCEECKDNENVTTCPSCRVMLQADKMTRNILAENFIEAVTKGGHDDDLNLYDVLRPSAPPMPMEMESLEETVFDEHENNVTTFCFTDLIKENCTVISSTGPASHQKGL